MPIRRPVATGAQFELEDVYLPSEYRRRPPDFVREVLSRSRRERDQTTKKDLRRNLRVEECFLLCGPIRPPPRSSHSPPASCVAAAARSRLPSASRPAPANPKEWCDVTYRRLSVALAWSTITVARRGLYEYLP